MRVRLTQQVQGTRDGQDWPAAGSEVDLPDAEARALIASGSAVEAGERSETVLVPPAGIHTPGTTAMTAGEGGPPLVAVPADAAADPEGVRRALKARAEGDFERGPENVAHQDRTGRALTREALDKAGEDERATREALAAVEAPKVGEKPAARPADRLADKK